jgi:hypothetical protein
MSGIIKAEAVNVPTPASAAETVALTIPFTTGNSSNVSLAAPPGVGKPSKNNITGSLNITTGATATAVVVRCRQGGVAGTQVDQTLTVGVAAAATVSIPFAFNDAAPNFGQAYSITVSVTGQSGAGNVNEIGADVTDYQ